MARTIPDNPTLADIVESYGGLQAYLDDPIIKSGNNGHGYHDIVLMLDLSIQGAATKTGRNWRTMKKIKDIHDKEVSSGK